MTELNLILVEDGVQGDCDSLQAYVRRPEYEVNTEIITYLDSEETPRASMRGQSKCNVTSRSCFCVIRPREAVVDVFAGVRIDFVIIMHKL
jgi:hypothetical protein